MAAAAAADSMVDAHTAAMDQQEFGAAWRAMGIGAWVGGVALLHRQAVLPSATFLAGVAVFASIMICAAAAVDSRTTPGRLLLCGAVLAAGFSYAGWRAGVRLADHLAPAWEDHDLAIVGVVDEMPQVREDGLQFAFAIESAREEGVVAVPVVPSRVRLSWMRGQRDDRAVVAGAPALRAGQRWALHVRLRRPHGALNPEGFDAELWLFEQGLRATGVVRGDGVLLGESWAPVEQARQWGRDRLLLGGLEPGLAGTLAALAVGDQSAIAAADWDTYRDTGVAHLMSISGMHITMLGWLGARILAAGWRRCEPAMIRLPTPAAARWGGLAIAWAYALFAGWGVPAQRTVVMLGAACLLRSVALDWPLPLVALAAMLPVTLLDPWAVLQPGFWLSFAAVTWLIVSRPAREADVVEGPQPTPAGPGRLRTALRRHVQAGLRAQVIATVGLAPLALVAFQQVSLVGLVANLVAEPWVTLVVVPLALAGLVCPPAWPLAAAALLPLQRLLEMLARWPGSSLHVAAAPAWMVAAGLAGGVVLMLPLPWRLRGMGLPLVLPLLAPCVPRPAAGRFELLAVDVGQGSAVIVRTRSRLLVFDTGPSFGEAGDAGQRMIVPLLQARGERAVDLLVLSHADMDHVGGARSLVERWPVRALSSSLPASHPLLHAGVPHVPCAAGQRWTWDGVQFDILHPDPGIGDAVKSNARSCVLRVEDAQGHVALLTGDIEAPQEIAMLARDAMALRADILVVPHHGSRTSSTAAFIAAVHPGVAVMQLGYRNRYGHPAPDVVARYATAGTPVVRTDTCGAWRWFDGRASCARDERRRYWQWVDGERA